MATIVLGGVEGPTDEAILRRLVQDAGGELGSVFGRRGKDHLLKSLPSFNYAARHRPWAVVIDLNTRHACAPALLGSVLPAPAALMCVRVAVRQVEAWLMADRERLARFLRVSIALVSQDPDELRNAKQAMVNLARRSRVGAIRADMVPEPGSGVSVGPAYASRIIEFATDDVEGWRPSVAEGRSPSLRRARAALAGLVRDAS